MAYIGNTADQQAFTPAIDFFSGNGVTTAFTLSRPVASVAQVQATIENVPQNPGTAFTVSGNTITFDGAPASGTNNIYVYYTSPITQVIQPGQGTVGTAQINGNLALWNKSGSTINYTAGNVGIGTASPTRQLELGTLGAMRMQTGSITMDCTPTPGAIDGFVWNMSSGYYNWSSSGSTRMLIDSSGRITTPAQPAFHAYPNASFDISTTNAVIPYNTTLFNIGGHYNTGTQRFTAPIAGVYFFSASFWALPGNFGNMALCLNGNNSTMNAKGRIGGSSAQYLFGTLNSVINLNANDFVDCRCVENTQPVHINNGFNNFTGYLLG